MKGLSIRQPWVFAIFHLGKDIENRDWRESVTGTIAVHASATCSKYDYCDGLTAITQMVGVQQATKIPLRDDLAKGCIVGVVDVEGVVTESDSPWFVGKYGFKLARPRLLLEPIPFKGMLGFWDVPADIEQAMTIQIGESTLCQI